MGIEKPWKLRSLLYFVNLSTAFRHVSIPLCDVLHIAQSLYLKLDQSKVMTECSTCISLSVMS